MTYWQYYPDSARQTVRGRQREVLPMQPSSTAQTTAVCVKELCQSSVRVNAQCYVGVHVTAQCYDNPWRRWEGRGCVQTAGGSIGATFRKCSDSGSEGDSEMRTVAPSVRQVLTRSLTGDQKIDPPAIRAGSWALSYVLSLMLMTYLIAYVLSLIHF